MRWVALFTVAVMIGFAAVILFGKPLSAQPNVKMLDACKVAGDELSARDLPSQILPGECSVKDKVITDGGIGSVLPDPGESVYVESLTLDGSQELEISHNKDGSIELSHVGEESNDSESSGDASSQSALTALASRGPNECRDRAFNNLGYRVEGGLRYYTNLRTKPAELTPKATSFAVRRGGNNITTTRNTCRLGDRVPARLAYSGRTGRVANVSSGGRCRGVDRLSVVSFGALPRGVLAVTCTYSRNSLGYDKVVTSDVKVNKTRFKWTTRPGARSCRNKFDLESVITHERGHTFGLGHVSESRHGNLTMSTRINGACQASERTLGRGDVLGLDREY